MQVLPILFQDDPTVKGQSQNWKRIEVDLELNDLPVFCQIVFLNTAGFF